MKTLKNLWNNFKARPDAWFFYGFLATFTLSIRKVIKFYPIAGQFNEYAGIYLYLSDIFLILTLISWGIVILCNKLHVLSNIKLPFGLRKPFFTFLLLFGLWAFISILWSSNQTIAIFRAIKILEFSLLFLYIIARIVPPRHNCSTPVQMFHVEHSTGQAWNILRGKRGKIKYEHHPEFTSGSGEISDQIHDEGRANVSRGTFEGFSEWNTAIFFKIIVFLGSIQAIIGIWQFFIQHSVGATWLRESLISSNLSGVAKIIVGGEKYIRAYGLFPHPNILGGFLVFSIIITWAYYKIFYPSTNVPPRYKCSTPVQMFHPGTNVPRETYYRAGVEHSTGQAWNILRGSCGTFFGANGDLSIGQALNTVFHKFYPFINGLQLLALLLTFSKSAVIGLIIAILYIFWKIHKRYFDANELPQQKCSTPKKMFHVEHYTGQAWNILLGKRGTIPSTRHSEFISESIEIPDQVRNDNYADVSRGTFSRTLLFHVEHYWKEICIFILVLIIGFNNLNLDWNTFLLKSLDERGTYITVSRETISGNFLHGVGIGQFVMEINNNVPPVRNANQECSTWNITCRQDIARKSDTKEIVAGGHETLLEPWQYQPVHNVFLLIWSELGLIGLILFCMFLYCLFRRHAQSCQRPENGEVSEDKQFSVLCTLLKGSLFALLFVAFFDHYLWDIQQGQVLFWLALGLFSSLAAFSKSGKNC